MLMRYSWCLFYVFFIVILDKKFISNILIQWISAISIICVIFNFIIVDNIAYFNAYYKHQKSYSICLKLSERIESYLNYNTNIKVAIIGNLDENKYKSTNVTAKITNEITNEITAR